MYWCTMFFISIFLQIGQNLYAHKPGLNLTLGMLEWSDYEKVYYNYNTGGCRKEPCGHYTQVSHLVGGVGS